MPCYTYSASAFELRGREVDILVDLYDDTEEREYIPRVQSMIRQINWSDWFSRMETSMHFNTSAEWFLMNCSHDRVGMPMRIELEDHYPLGHSVIENRVFERAQLRAQSVTIQIPPYGVYCTVRLRVEGI